MVGEGRREEARGGRGGRRNWVGGESEQGTAVGRRSPKGVSQGVAEAEPAAAPHLAALLVVEADHRDVQHWPPGAAASGGRVAVLSDPSLHGGAPPPNAWSAACPQDRRVLLARLGALPSAVSLKSQLAAHQN